MIDFARKLTLLFILFAHTIVNAEDKPINAAVGWAKPPYVFNDIKKGFEIELVTEIFRSQNMQVTFKFVPHGRIGWLLQFDDVDIGLTINKKVNIGDASLSEEYITYTNVVVTKPDIDHSISNAADLRYLSVIAFQNAHKVLGQEYLAMTAINKQYHENADQVKQVRQFLKGKVDAIVLDINIFKHISKTLTGEDQSKHVKIFPIFSPSHYRVGCKTKALCEEFNQGLKSLVANGTYQLLLDKYKLEMQPHATF